LFTFFFNLAFIGFFFIIVFIWGVFFIIVLIGGFFFYHCLGEVAASLSWGVIMGIHGLWNLLKTKHAHVLHEIAGLDQFKGMRFALDVSGEMHSIVERGDNPNEVFTRMAHDLKLLEIELIFVFDGKRSPAKVHEHERRSDARQQARDRTEERQQIIQQIKTEPPSADALVTRAIKEGGELQRIVQKHQRLNVDLGEAKMELELNLEALVQEIQAKAAKQADRSSVTDEHYQSLIRTLDQRGLPYLIARTEAEKLCAQLVQNKRADVVVSNDGDTLTFGAPCMLRNFGRNSDRFPTQMVYLDEVLASLKLETQAQFVDFCILCGCDFTESHGLPTVGPVAALKIIQQHKSINAYLASTDWVAKQHKLAHDPKWSSFTLDQFQYQVARQMFLDITDQIMEVTDSPLKRQRSPDRHNDQPPAKVAKIRQDTLLPPPEF
jgi:5'-3' exonuclease